jgi:hypothetical protein
VVPDAVPDAVPELVVLAPELVLEIFDAEAELEVDALDVLELDVPDVLLELVPEPEPLPVLAPALVEVPVLVPPASATWHSFDAGSQTKGARHVRFAKQAQLRGPVQDALLPGPHAEASTPIGSAKSTDTPRTLSAEDFMFPPRCRRQARPLHGSGVGTRRRSRSPLQGLGLPTRSWKCVASSTATTRNGTCST